MKFAANVFLCSMFIVVDRGRLTKKVVKKGILNFRFPILRKISYAFLSPQPRGDT